MVFSPAQPGPAPARPGPAPRGPLARQAAHLPQCKKLLFTMLLTGQIAFHRVPVTPYFLNFDPGILTLWFSPRPSPASRRPGPALPKAAQHLAAPSHARGPTSKVPPGTFEVGQAALPSRPKWAYWEESAQHLPAPLPRPRYKKTTFYYVAHRSNRVPSSTWYPIFSQF